MLARLAVDLEAGRWAANLLDEDDTFDSEENHAEYAGVLEL